VRPTTEANELDSRSRIVRRPGVVLAVAALALAGYGPARAGSAARSAQSASAPPNQAASASPQPSSARPASDTHEHARDPDDDDDEDDGPIREAVERSTPRCRRQQPLPFLVRGNYLHHRGEHARAIRWRTEHYGYFEGFGEREWNAHRPRFYARRTRFMGLPVTINQRVIPALRCVEAEIQRTCRAHPYRPRTLAGIRFRNTYHSGEITNHAYGIAIDIDPDRNTCCHCVGHWSEHPLCRRETRTIWERMVMPECWVNAFERYGFYWLGHDTLQDTMHFEFLADPDRIVRGR
jgi:hypothetical protein